MRFRRARTLRARMLVLVLLAVLPALGMILYNGLHDRRVARTQAEQRALNVARNVALDQQRIILDSQQLLQLLTQLPPVRRGQAACTVFFRRLLEDESPYVNFVIVRPDGDVICSGLPYEPGTNLSDRAWFRRVVATRTFAIGDYVVGRIVKGGPIITFAYPLLADDGTLEGIVTASVPITWLQERIAAAELPERSAVTVFDPSLTVIARYPPDPGLVGKPPTVAPLVQRLRTEQGEATFEAPGMDGVPRLYAMRPLLTLPGVEPIRLTVGIATDVAYAPADRALAGNLAGLFLLTVFVAATAWWGSDVFILRQVRSLMRATRLLGAGVLTARAVRAGTGGEIGELATSFNEMAHALERNAAEIRDHLARIGRLNRVYAVLSGINSAILRIRNEDALLRAICRIAVHQGRFPLATVYRVDATTGDATLAAWTSSTSLTDEDLKPATRAMDGTSLITEVITKNDVFVVSDPNDARLHPWKTLVEAQDFHSAAALPLRVNERVFGVLTLFASEAAVFDAEELRLLREMAADASLGLQYLENERRLAFAANYDALTELPNRTLFRDRLQQAVAAAKQSGRHAAVLVARVNRMADINATLGHHVGDIVLRETARYLTGVVRQGDTVARLGSGEFGVLLTELADSDEAATLANEILEKAPQRVLADAQEIFVTMSIGVAIFPTDGETGPVLIQNASLARQAIVSEVANTLTFFSAELNTQAQEKRRIEYALRSALAQDEFVLFYQPVVDVRSRMINGVETLLRWDSAELGFVSPGTFIPVAEETSLIVPIGEWIVAGACRQGQAWHARGFDVRISLNVSVGQLHEPDFADRVTRILTETGFDPAKLALGLEITETALMENVASVIPAIERFRAMGMMMYIDDFGTGYSSLAYLRQLPLDTLKIDTSFIRDMAHDPNAVAVVRAIIAMAKSLGLRVIAEGVETEEQFALLRDLGCDSVQGYLFGRPERPEAVEAKFGKRL
ncbi:MAG TPA: EAL domain-containing protein [Gemmatimonadaceae bacterium]|nr:EAL domain-containing protein [Gemmatimonadaceae bacterium]